MIMPVTVSYTHLCAVMGNKELFAGSVDEIETAAPFFDYEGKYQMVDSHICLLYTSIPLL